MPLDPEVLESQDFKDALAEAVTAATSPLQDSIHKLQSTNTALKQEKTTVASEFNDFKSKFDGIDVEAMKARLEEVDSDETRQLLAQGEFDKVYEKQKAQLTAEHQSQLDAAKKEVEDAQTLAQTLQGTLVNTVRDGGISQAFVAAEADKSQLRAATAIARDVVMVNGEERPVVSVGTDGKSTFRHSTSGEILQNAEGTFGYTDWLKHLAENEGLPLFAKPNGHGDRGKATEGNPSGMVKSKMTEDEKRKFKQEHGIPAYNALPYS